MAVGEYVVKLAADGKSGVETIEVLVLDDPAMGLDAVMRREFLEAMIDVVGDEGRGVLFSSHILSDVERIAEDHTAGDLHCPQCGQQFARPGSIGVGSASDSR